MLVLAMSKDLVPGHGWLGHTRLRGSSVQNMSERRTAYFLLFATAVCFGGTWPAGKLAVEDVTPFTVAATRFTRDASAAVWAARGGCG